MLSIYSCQITMLLYSFSTEYKWLFEDVDKFLRQNAIENKIDS